MISKNTIDLIKNLLKPLVDTGVIPETEFRELLLLAKTNKKKNDLPVIPAIGVSRKEAAKRLGISLRGIDRLIERAELPCKKIGKRRVIIPESGIANFLTLEEIK
jgi:excisionase family DNA binding protein